MKKIIFLLSFTFACLTQTSIADTQSLMADVNSRITNIDTSVMKKMIDEKQKFVLLDVRMPTEIKRMGSIDTEQNKELPRGWLEIRIGFAVPDKNTPIVTYCGGGIRSALAADTLQKMGYTNVKNYKDGFLGWEGKGHKAKYYQ